MDRVNGTDWFDIGGGKRGFRAQNAGLGIPGTEVTDVFLNGVQEELLFLIENAGLVPAGGDRKQVAAGIRSGKLSYFAAGGTANAITIALDPALIAYSAGLVLRIKIATANSAAVTLNVNGLGAKNVLGTNGAALVAGDLLVGDVATVIYDGAAFRLTALARSEIAGLIKAQKVVFWRASQSNTTIPHNAGTLVTGFDAITSQLVDTAYASGVWTIGASDAGKWLIWAFAQGGGNTRVQTTIMINGGATSIGDNGAAANAILSASNLNLVDLAAGNTIQLRLYQSNSGAASQVLSGALMAIRIGT